MAIRLPRSWSILVEVNNFAEGGQTKVSLRGEEIHFEKFCEMISRILFEEIRGEEVNALKAAYFQRLAYLEVIPGFTRYGDRLGLPERIETLTDIQHKTQITDGRLLIGFGKYLIDFSDFLVMVEYFLTNCDLMGSRDPRIEIVRKIKAFVHVDEEIVCPPT